MTPARRVSSVSRTLIALALPAAVALAGCGRHASAPRESAPGEPVAVKVIRVGGGTAGAELVLPGRVQAREEVTIVASAAARVTALPVAEGRAFRRGQTLARFDAPETRRALEAARAGLAAARIRHEQAVLQEARMESLFVARVASQREREIAQSERGAAAAEEATARAAEAQWSASASIPAPFAGVVVRHRVDAGQGVNPGQPLLDVRSTGTDEVETAVPESGVERVSTAPAWVQIGDGPWRAARLVRLEGMTDFSTRTRVAFLRPASGTWPEPGAFARVRFAATEPAAAAAAPASLSVPATSVVRRGALTGVYVIRGGRAELRWLRLGRASGGSIEVLAGLWPGEDVALETPGLADGRAVRPAR